MDINFNDIINSVSELADNAVKLAKDVAAQTGKKTEEIVGASKVKLDIMKMENEIKTVNQKLGATVYEASVSEGAGYTEVIDQYIAELATKHAQLEQLKKQAAAMKKTVVCEACKAVNPKESFFCSRCGAPLPVTEPDAVEVTECEACEPCGEQSETAEACDACDACEETCCTEAAEEIIEQAKVDGADEETAEAVAEDAAKEQE